MTDTTNQNTSEAVLDLLKSSYPSQYYGIPSSDASAISLAVDVWAAIDANGQPHNVTTLPSSSTLVPLTETQFSLFIGATNVELEPTSLTLLYPDRYYAEFDTSAAQPTEVTGWFDTWTLSTTKNIPQAKDMLGLSDEQWNARKVVGQGVENGTLIDYMPPPLPVPINVQAEDEMTWVSSQASMASAMGETFTDEMKTYVKAIQAIANGTDTSSKLLPQRPAAVMA